MKQLILLLLSASSSWAGYAYSGTATIPAPTTASKTNFTVVFSFNDALLKTVANGGQIQSTSTRNAATVPNDFVLTNDSTCGSITGAYKWGFESYLPTAGTGFVWMLIPSWTTGFTVTVCIGNAAVTTYQGGAAASEFDSFSYFVFHLSEASGNMVNFGYGAGTQSPVAVTRQTEKIGNGYFCNNSACRSSSSGFVGYPVANAPFTLTTWINPTSTAALRIIAGASSQLDFTPTPSPALNLRVNLSDYVIVNVTPGTWYFLTAYYDGSTFWTSVNGGAQVAQVTGASVSSTTFSYWSNNVFSNMQGDETTFSTTRRSDDWLVDMYNIENNPPALGALTPLAPSASTNMSQVTIF